MKTYSMLHVPLRMLYFLVIGFMAIALVSFWPRGQNASVRLNEALIKGDVMPRGESPENLNSMFTPAPAGDYPDATVALGGNILVSPSVAAGLTSLNASTSAGFKGVLSADPVTGVVRITNAYPKGTYTITVRGFNGASAEAPQTFVLTVQQGTNCSPVFLAAADVSVGTAPRSIAVADFNNDGKQDFASGNATAESVSIRLGDGAGGFSGTTEVPVQATPQSVAVGDLNNDGKQDLAVANINSSSISIRLGDGSGGFSGTTNISLPGRPEGVVLGDFNDDGKPDIAATGEVFVWIRLGNGAGAFSGSTEVIVGSSPRAIAIGDFNNDGNQDLATANFGSNTASVRLGDGAGGFSGTTEVSTGPNSSQNPVSVAISDLNNDGKQDLVISNFTAGSVAIRLGDGGGNFSGTTNISVGGAGAVVTADFNNDGNQDFAVLASSIAIYAGNGAGAFTLLSTVGVSGGVRSIAIGDFNGDGKQDFVSGFSFSSVAVRLGVCSTGSTTAVTSTANPSDFGQSVTFSATVTSSAGTPTGVVQFKDNGTNIGSPVTLSGLGSAQLAVSSLAPGTHAITAEYGGSANFTPSTGTLPGGQVVRPQPSLSINDVTVIEGDAGTKTMSFTVTLSAASNLMVTVDFLTADQTTTAPADYQSNSGTLTFLGGARTRTISVVMNGDTSIEADETFAVNLVSPTNATISKSQGTGTILNDDPSELINFNQTSYTVSESAGFVTITVNRTSNNSLAVSVDYATSDSGALSTCSQTNGLASSRCDFIEAAGTLAFAAGETQKTFRLLVNRDAYVEGPETLTINLLNPSAGAVLTTPSTTTVTITDVATGPGNPIDDVDTFVRMHYHDFLNREPDQSGLDFWTNQITSCGSDAQCNEVRRIDVSASFFLSIEFQQSGYLVERFYKVAYGDAQGTSTFGSNHQLAVPMVRLSEFLRGTQRIGQGVIVLQPGWEQVLENNKQAYALEFVQTARFIFENPTTLTPSQFVGRLNSRTNFALSESERTAAINLFGGAASSSNPSARAQALRQVAEDTDFFNAEFNRAFVLAQYFGYLRRNPNDAPESTLDYTGYDFWLTKLNQFNGNYINAEMVKAFLSSTEYRQSFGP